MDGERTEFQLPTTLLETQFTSSALPPSAGSGIDPGVWLSYSRRLKRTKNRSMGVGS